MVNIYDNANQMAKDLQETEQFKDLKKSLENLKNKPESLDLYQRMDKLQQKSWLLKIQVNHFLTMLRKNTKRLMKKFVITTN